ncbi:hypothetical protein [Burkholderia sp. BCC1640]|nr:hypothetical protein [Burkholderia sp. BCC1640]
MTGGDRIHRFIVAGLKGWISCRFRRGVLGIEGAIHGVLSAGFASLTHK